MRKNKKARRKEKENITFSEKEKNENDGQKTSAERCFETSYNIFSAHNNGGYFSFLLNALRRTSSYKTYSKVNAFFKPFIFIMRFFRILFISVAWIQASALLLIAAAAVLVILPILLLLLFIAILITRINLKYKKVKMAPYINEKEVVIFFREQDFSRFFFENVSALAENYTVLVVIPYPVRILNKKNMFFLNSEIISKNIIVMYEHCYFSIRKSLLKQAKQLMLVF